MWLILYNCPGGIMARVAAAPWSQPTLILGPADQLGCRMVMIPEGCGQRRDFWPRRHVNGKFERGGTYAPYVRNRYTNRTPSEGQGRDSTSYWVVSNWNHEVSVMRTTLHVDPR